MSNFQLYGQCQYGYTTQQEIEIEEQAMRDEQAQKEADESAYDRALDLGNAWDLGGDIAFDTEEI